MLKVLNVLGYISLVTVLLYALIFLFSFDLTLQIINVVMILAVICVNIFAIKGRKYIGIRILVSLIVIAILSTTIYYSYMFIAGNAFKNQIEAIYDEEGNEKLSVEEIRSYVVMYIPDKIYIDEIAKMGGKKGYIRFYNIEGYDEPIKYSVSPSSMGTHMDHFTIIFNNKRYRFI